MKKRIKNKKGFTLIELLAVIVILGLLMAIAIPSVTKYITQSRKKTVVTTIGNYITAMVNEVNDLTYSFTGSNTVYAVPIECISLERGGTNPFGEWHQANKDYWAYVLIQYDEENSSYTYGYTFKDSSGYGIYPTIQSKLNTQGKQIQTKLDLSKPETGKVTTITPVDNWDGFEVDASTDLVVLEATKEGEVGNGKTTCTLCQKGKNYEQIQQDKVNGEEEVIEEDVAYAIYSENDKTLTFVRSENEIKAGDVYDGINVTNVYTDFEDGYYYSSSWYDIASDVEKVIFKDIIKPEDTSYWFSGFRNCSYFDVTNLDTSNVILMGGMFDNAGSNATTLEIVGLDKWDTSNVTDMHALFMSAGYDVKTFEIVGMDKWDTSNVTDMSSMFNAAGFEAEIFNIGNLGEWDTSNVTTMSSMFFAAGSDATTFDIGNLSKWDTSNVTNMGSMFDSAGFNARTWNIGDLSEWDVSNVTYTGMMFENAGSNAETFNIGNLSKWDTSNVTDMSSMFNNAGTFATTFNIGDLSNWDTSNVTDMYSMFSGAGSRATTFNIGDLSQWKTSNVTNMSGMFYGAGETATTFDIGDLSKWNTAKVKNMHSMFRGAGEYATYKLDLSKWNVDKVTSYDYFNDGVEDKVTPPKWVN